MGKTKAPGKQVIVGVYDMGYEQVELVLRQGSGAEFYLIPEKGKLPRIKIGADEGVWSRIVMRLHHEALEMTFARERARYTNAASISDDSDGYLFVCDHPTFTDCCARVGEFLAASLPDLGKTWEQWKREYGRR